MESSWINPESTLLDLYNLPHNKFGLTQNLNQDDLFISPEKIREIARFVGKRATKKDYVGAKIFVRAVYKDESQRDNNWWLDAETILRLNDDFDELGELDITKYVEEIAEACHEYFSEFGKVHKVCTLVLPKNEGIIGISQVSNLTALSSLLGECLERVYFPITKREWIREYSQF